jgi:hypothetical protein
MAASHNRKVVPGARPMTLTDVRDLARQYTADAIMALLEVMETARDPATRALAARSLLDRGWNIVVVTSRGGGGTNGDPVTFSRGGGGTNGGPVS